MNRIIIDVEAISTKHIYDLGYVIVDKNFNILEKRQFIIIQVYDNKLSYETAYYKIKRPKYVSLLKGRKARKSYWGHAMRALKADIKNYGITEWYAFNSEYDRQAFEISCSWFGAYNPLAKLVERDIRKIARPIFEQPTYKHMCVTQGLTTAKGYLKTTAEVAYRYIATHKEFVEDHMGLQDALIETEILETALLLGGDVNEFRNPLIKAV